MKKLLLFGVALLATNVLLFMVVRSRRADDSAGSSSGAVRESPAPSPSRPEGSSSGLRLQWDATPDPRVVAYRIYVRSETGEFEFDEPTATVAANDTEWQIEGLPRGAYFAVVTAATSTEESPPTAEIAFTVP